MGWQIPGHCELFKHSLLQHSIDIPPVLGAARLCGGGMVGGPIELAPQRDCGISTCGPRPTAPRPVLGPAMNFRELTLRSSL